MPITIKPTQMKYKDPTTGDYEPVVAAADLSNAIDDTTTSATTLWSSQKTSQEVNAKVADVQVNGTSVVTSGVANVPLADGTNPGAVIVRENTDGLKMADGKIQIAGPSSGQIQSGSTNYRPITPYIQHESAFFGLSKAAGVDLASETVTVGTYPASSKTAINGMIGSIQAPSSASAGDFLCYNGTAWVATTLATWSGGSY